MKIGVVSFLNAWPLYGGLTGLTIRPRPVNPDIEVVRDTPSRLSSRMNSGQLDAALVSSVEVLRNGWMYHPDYCIRSNGRVASILLFSPDCVPEGDGVSLVRNLRKVYLDPSSRSSVVMLTIILQIAGNHLVRTEFRTASRDALKSLYPGEAFLIIGDPALRLSKDYRALDAGKLFHRLTGRGMVYALWAVRDTSVFSILDSAFVPESDFDWTKAATRSDLPVPFVRSYLYGNIRYDLNPDSGEILQFLKRRLAYCHI